MAYPEYTFRDFIQDEMRKRDMSARQFADVVGVANSTISRAIDARDPQPPSLDFLMKLAKATGVSLAHLTELAYPDVARQTKPTPSSQILAQLIDELPEHLRTAVVALIRSGIR